MLLEPIIYSRTPHIFLTELKQNQNKKKVVIAVNVQNFSTVFPIFTKNITIIKL